DSADSFPQPRCHPETRTKMLNDLHNWAIHAQYGRSICWLHGPAGAGKSAIMQTLCERLHRSGRFGGAFFFKREHATRGNARVLFATLAYQLALNVLELKPLISQSVEADPSVVGRGMDFQLQKAIVEPCSVRRGSPAAVLLIDGLDECDTPEVQAEILRVIASAVRQHPQRFRFLIASRPEAHICEVIKELSCHLIQDINVEQSFHDVETYFRDQFSRIHREHRDTMSGIPAPWPSEQIIDRLVRKSSGHFIYASTVIKFTALLLRATAGAWQYSSGLRPFWETAHHSNIRMHARAIPFRFVCHHLASEGVSSGTFRGLCVTHKSDRLLELPLNHLS
ncbi:hypothetical protein C8R47DRAFT_995605, partial [Mycena vitilis]